MRRVFVDIETTGLNPWEHRVTTVAIYDPTSEAYTHVFDNPGDEEWVLAKAHGYFITTEPDEVITWNGAEFDMPFIALRSKMHGIDGPHIRITDKRGKYNTPIFNATWWGAAHIDIAYPYEEKAKELGVKWSLKPVADAMGFKGKTFDFSTGKTVLDMTDEARKAYCMSDAQLTHKLWQHLQPKGHAVLLDEDISIL